jgi:multidrug transporter EmrE-like cation transporter
MNESPLDAIALTKTTTHTYTDKRKAYLSLHLTVMLYAFSSILAKMASQYSLLSLPFLAYLALELLVLMIYAYFWQQTLKRLSSSTAYANRAIAIVWTFVAGILFFHETFRWNNLLGIALILWGVRLVVLEDE